MVGRSAGFVLRHAVNIAAISAGQSSGTLHPRSAYHSSVQSAQVLSKSCLGAADALRLLVASRNLQPHGILTAVDDPWTGA